MGLESSVTKISDLNPLWPLGSDQKLAGDDHIRNIKIALQTISFLKNIVSFTASGTWTRPVGTKYVVVYCLGGGGGGNGGLVQNHAGGGGASGSIAIKWLDVTTIASATVTIGSGGSGGAMGGGLGSNGGFTNFASIPDGVLRCSAAPGGSGQQWYIPGTPLPRNLNVGDVVFQGALGGFGDPPPGLSVQVWGGQGGGYGGCSDNPAMDNSGGGGGGGYSSPGGVGAGREGGSGYCVILEFGV